MIKVTPSLALSNIFIVVSVRCLKDNPTGPGIVQKLLMDMLNPLHAPLMMAVEEVEEGAEVPEVVEETTEELEMVAPIIATNFLAMMMMKPIAENMVTGGVLIQGFGISLTFLFGFFLMSKYVNFLLIMNKITKVNQIMMIFNLCSALNG